MESSFATSPMSSSFLPCWWGLYFVVLFMEDWIKSIQVWLVRILVACCILLLLEGMSYKKSRLVFSSHSKSSSVALQTRRQRREQEQLQHQQDEILTKVPSYLQKQNNLCSVKSSSIPKKQKLVGTLTRTMKETRYPESDDEYDEVVVFSPETYEHGIDHVDDIVDIVTSKITNDDVFVTAVAKGDGNSKKNFVNESKSSKEDKLQESDDEEVIVFHPETEDNDTIENVIMSSSKTTDVIHLEKDPIFKHSRVECISTDNNDNDEHYEIDNFHEYDCDNDGDATSDDTKITIQYKYNNKENETTKRTKNQNVFMDDSREKKQNDIITVDHPGLEQFWNWCDVETSLFRCYGMVEMQQQQQQSLSSNTITTTSQKPTEPTTYIKPSSKRGTVPIELHIHNKLPYNVGIYWINYNGRPEFKGYMKPTSLTSTSTGETFVQITYIDHPWMFCRIDDMSNIASADCQTTILHYVPYRVIPTVDPESSTVNPITNVGIHKFTLLPPSHTPQSPAKMLLGKKHTTEQHQQQQQQQQHQANSSDNDNHTNQPYKYFCRIDDPVLPYPSSDYIKTPRDAAGFALLHCYRMQYNGWSVLMKYITKLVMDPSNKKYQTIRISNPTFTNTIWNYHYARGLLYACGFLEDKGYLHIGGTCSNITSTRSSNQENCNSNIPVNTNAVPTIQRRLSRPFVQDLSQLLLAIGMWERREKRLRTHQQQQQPIGFDGSGRAGYRAL